MNLAMRAISQLFIWFFIFNYKVKGSFRGVTGRRVGIDTAPLTFVQNWGARDILTGEIRMVNTMRACNATFFKITVIAKLLLASLLFTRSGQAFPLPEVQLAAAL